MDSTVQLSRERYQIFCMLLAYVHLNQLCTTKMVVLEGLLRKKFNKQEFKIKNQKQHKTRDFRRKQQYGRHVFKTGASLSKWDS